MTGRSRARDRSRPSGGALAWSPWSALGGQWFDATDGTSGSPVSAWTARVKVTPVGGSTSNYDVTFAASAAWAASSGSGPIVTTGTGQMVDIELEAEGTSGDTIYVSNVTLYQSEAL